MTNDAIGYRDPYPRLHPERMRGRDGNRFIVDAELLAAANVALALGRPLLLTGEPGCGKTDFAWAAASSLGSGGVEGQAVKPLEQYVRSETRARDLLYTYDAVRRFNDTQGGTDEDKRRAAFPQNYITLEPFGQGLISPVQRVVLIDEIDKAPRDLPNDLLRELDQGWFEIQEIPKSRLSPPAGAIDEGHRNLQREMRRPGTAPKPFVIITSNVERQLPDAFLRRCVFYYIPFPDDKRLYEIVIGYFERDRRGEPPGGPMPELEPEVAQAAVSVVWHLREALGLTKKPATAELIDWVNALQAVFEPERAAARIAEAAAAIEANQRVPWRSLPGLACLLKLNEDRERVLRGG